MNPRLQRRWIGLVALTIALASCKPSSPALSVLITLSPNVSAACIQLAAISDQGERLTDPMVRGDRTRLVVAVFKEKNPADVKLEARGFINEDCTGLNEVSERVSATFPASGFTSVNVELNSLPTSVDLDGDGYRAVAQGGTDCDDADPAVHPKAGEVCSDGVDNDCQGGADCQDPSCASKSCVAGELVVGSACQAGACTESLCSDGKDNDGDGAKDCADADCAGKACGNGGSCDANHHCTGATAELCADNVDNDGDGLVDCADRADCATKTCEDGNLCTVGETCGANNVCAGGTQVTCTTSPGQCYAPTGTCAPATGACIYPPRSAGSACEDTNKCTTPDTCDGQGRCRAGAPKSCNTPGRCEVAMGATCDVQTGNCGYPAAPTGTTCDDGVACTAMDKCDATKGCAGVAYTCAATPGTCFASACKGDGTCAGSPLPAGSTCANDGRCAPDGVCMKGYAYTPANFSPAALTPSGAITVDCAVEVDSSVAVSTAPIWCGRAGPKPIILSQGQGNAEIYVLPMARLNVTAGGSIRLRGSRPVVLAVFDDATVDGVIDASAETTTVGAGGIACAGTNAVADPGNPAGGGGGGGFGGAGGGGGLGGLADPGGTAGPVVAASTNLTPLRGGCSGGTGGNATMTNGLGGGAGGAVQLSVAGTLSVGGRISAAGGGGRGSTAANVGAGGGASGGGILLEAATLDLKPAAIITALGGGGGEGFHQQPLNNRNGQNGADGHVTDALPAAGGNDAMNTRGGPGGNGATGTQPPVVGGNGTSVNGLNGGDGTGGGGGGGVGRIVLIPHGACTPPGTVSPAPNVVGATCP